METTLKKCPADGKTASHHVQNCHDEQRRANEHAINQLRQIILKESDVSYGQGQKETARTTAEANPGLEQASVPLAEPEASEAFEAIFDPISAPCDPGEAGPDGESHIDQTPLANRFAYRVLVLWSREEKGSLSMEEFLELKDSLDGLGKCCFQAIRDLWAPRGPGDTEFRAKCAFIEERFLTLLMPYRDLPEPDLRNLALRGQFKNLPAEIRCDLLDRIRTRYTKKARILDFLYLEKERPIHDGVASSRRAIELINLHRNELLALVGEDSYETLTVAVNFGLNDYSSVSKQERKSGLTNAISQRLYVKERQATYRKKRLHESMSTALKQGHPVVSEIYEALIGPPEEPFAPQKVTINKYHDEAFDGPMLSTEPAGVAHSDNSGEETANDH